MGGQDRLGYPLGLASEHEIGVRRIFRLVEAALREFLEQKHLIIARRPLGHERLPRAEFDQPDMVPVVKAGALHALVRNLEAERVDQHQLHI